jgi:hypothetical protein
MITHDLPLKIKATEKTPLFEYSPKEGYFSIVGASIPDNTGDYYKPIFIWAQEYVQNKDKNIKLYINLDLEYFSTQSIVFLIKILKLFQVFNQISINWYYDGEEMLECGQDLSSIINIPFNFISKI